MYYLEQPSNEVKLKQQVKQIVEDISKGKDKWDKEEHRKMQEKYEVGPFRKWKIDIARLKEISKLVDEQQAEMHKNRGPYDRQAYGSGKLQKAKELQRLIYEIENG